MAAKATHNLVVKTGEYVCPRTGQTKGRWQHIGKVFKHDDGGTSIKLDAIPILKDWDGWVSIFPIDDQNSGQQTQQQPQTQPAPQSIPPTQAYDQEPDEVPF